MEDLDYIDTTGTDALVRVQIVLYAGQGKWLKDNNCHIVYAHGAWHVKREDVWWTCGYDDPKDAIIDAQTSLN